MSSDVTSLIPRASMPPNGAPAPHYTVPQDVTERIPVEIWQEILLFSIACPLLLDLQTVRKHGVAMIAALDCRLVAKYKQSEIVRTHLRLVCQSWNQFLDEHSDRLVQLTPRVPSGYWPPVKRWDRVVRIDGPQYTYCFCDELCWPPSLRGSDWVSHIDSPSHFSSTERNSIRAHLHVLDKRCKVVLLPGFWRSELAGQPGLCSVRTLKEDFHRLKDAGVKASVLSSTYRQLTYLEIVIPTLNDPLFGLQLPLVTSLCPTVHAKRVPYSKLSTRSIIGRWELPNVYLIHIDGHYASETEIDAFHLFIRQVGRTVSTLILGAHQNRIAPSQPIFPTDIWAFLPALTRLGVTPADLLSIPGPPPNPGGALIDLLLDTKDMWSDSRLVEDLTMIFPTKWPPSTLGRVVLDELWGLVHYEATVIKRSGVVSPDHPALFAVLHRTGKGLTDRAGRPLDSVLMSAIREALGKPAPS